MRCANRRQDLCTNKQKIPLSQTRHEVNLVISIRAGHVSGLNRSELRLRDPRLECPHPPSFGIPDHRTPHPRIDCENIDTILDQIAEPNRHAAELQNKAAKLQHRADCKNEQRTPFLSVQLEHIPIALQLPAYPECKSHPPHPPCISKFASMILINLRCKRLQLQLQVLISRLRLKQRYPGLVHLVTSQNFVEPTVDPSPAPRGVSLGLVRAVDVADLSQHALRQLDYGLKAIAQYLVPRGAGAPISSSFTRYSNDMIALLNKVSLWANAVPGESADHSATFRSIDRRWYLRLADARQGRFGKITDGHATYALDLEMFLQS
ncbi:hypothetical protein DFP73DRAFT_588825 [Morchella snyderi]|nr:hypothetical protein DFP73DRAFT_588825 [Morchella snyderi]